MSSDHADLFEKARGLKALVVGDVMVDSYLWGKVDRISPEAPVPVVHVTSRSSRLGGAANVALNLKALGADPIVVSVIGDDDNAMRLDRLFQDQHLSTVGLLRSKDRSTTVKTRVISGHQHVVRVDEEQEDDLDQQDEDRFIQLFSRLVKEESPAVIVLEDYNKGVLTAGSIAAIISIAKQHRVPVAVDPKKKNFFAYKDVDLFKPNLKELREGSKVDVEANDLASIREAVDLLQQRLNNSISLITLSEHGAYVRQGGSEHIVKAHVRKIADVSGAGDTVIAVAALALALGKSAADIAELSNLAGGLVCEEVGVVPIDRERFKSEVESLVRS